MGSRRPFGMLLFTVVLAFVELVDGQCNRASQTITTGASSIQSPNYGGEHGKSADCSWKFNSLSNENALILTVTRLKLYGIFDGRKFCNGSYILIMNGEKVRCDRYVNVPTTASFCNSFYSDSSCNTLSEVNSCETAKLVTFPLEVKYEADGKYYGSNQESTRVWGFKMNYKFVKCPTRTTASPAIDLTTLSTTEKFRTKVADTTSSEIPQTSVFTTGYSSATTLTKSSKQTHATIGTSKSTANTKSSPATLAHAAISLSSTPAGTPSMNILTNRTLETTLITEDLKPNCIPLSLFAGVSGICGFLLIAVIVLLTVILRFKTRWMNHPDIERKSKDTPEGEYELPISHHKYEDIEKTDLNDANNKDPAISCKNMTKKDHGLERNARLAPEGECEPRYGGSHHKYEDVESADHRGANNEDSSLAETPGYESFLFSAENPPNHYEVSSPNPNTSL